MAYRVLGRLAFQVASTFCALLIIIFMLWVHLQSLYSIGILTYGMEQGDVMDRHQHLGLHGVHASVRKMGKGRSAYTTTLPGVQDSAAQVPTVGSWRDIHDKYEVAVRKLTVMLHARDQTVLQMSMVTRPLSFLNEGYLQLQSKGRAKLRREFPYCTLKTNKPGILKDYLISVYDPNI